MIVNIIYICFVMLEWLLNMNTSYEFNPTHTLKQFYGYSFIFNIILNKSNHQRFYKVNIY